MHPFGYAIHTHRLGVSVSGYQLSPIDSSSSSRDYQWNLIGKGDPQTNKKLNLISFDKMRMIIKRGDYLAARCSYVNPTNETVMTGLLDTQEMCNFFLVYYVKRNMRTLDMEKCSNFDVTYHWSDEFNVPESVKNETI